MDPELTNLIEILITLAAAFIAYVQHIESDESDG